MHVDKLKELLEEVRTGKRSVDHALRDLKGLPFEKITDATVDHHRHLRQGFPEVILGEGKTEDQILAIVQSMVDKGEDVLITRLEDSKIGALRTAFPAMQYDPCSRTATLITRPIKKAGKGTVVIITAGTTDIPVAEEARVTAEVMGNKVETIFDVGIAGIHRLMNYTEKIRIARVLIVVAGMEGALPSVVSALVDRPVIAVPTSTGYGVSFHGLAALLTMLNSCAPGVLVVNINNGFGAAYMASLINQS
jgi:NCAIR mutase (PurE)-related protein